MTGYKYALENLTNLLVLISLEEKLTTYFRTSVFNQFSSESGTKMGLSPTLKGRLKMHSSPERNRDRNDKIVQKSKKMNFVIWSNHTDNLLQGHKFGNYTPAMLNRSGTILLLSSLAIPILCKCKIFKNESTDSKKQIIPLLSIRAYSKL